MPEPRALTVALVEVIRSRCEDQGLSLTKLAEKAGINTPTLSRQLRGTGVIGVDEWDDLAHALGARDLEELLEEARRRT